MRCVLNARADAGYESLENYLYLDENGQTCFIKPANYHQKKKAKFKKQIGRVENMTYDADEDCFTCAEGRKLPLRRELSEWFGFPEIPLKTTMAVACLKSERKDGITSSDWL